MISVQDNYNFSSAELKCLSAISQIENDLSYKTYEALNAIYKKNGAITLVDTVKRELVWTVFLTDYPPTEHGALYERSLLRVAPSYRGRGYGRVLLDALIDMHQDKFLISVTSSKPTQHMNDSLGLHMYTANDAPDLLRKLMNIDSASSLHPTHKYYVNKPLLKLLTSKSM